MMDYKQMKYGLVGGFKGDEEKIDHIRSVASEITKNDYVVDIPKIVDTLDYLPHSGRLQFGRHVLAAAPNRDAIITGLMDHAYEEGSSDQSKDNKDDNDMEVEESATTGSASRLKSALEDEDYILVKNLAFEDLSLADLSSSDDEDEPHQKKMCSSSGGGSQEVEMKTQYQTLNAHRFHIIQIVIVMAPYCSKDTARKIFLAYLDSSSTLFRKEFIGQMVDSTALSDDTLYDVFTQKVTKEEKTIILRMCKKLSRRGDEAKAGQKPTRVDFLRRLIHEKKWVSEELANEIAPWCLDDLSSTGYFEGSSMSRFGRNKKQIFDQLRSELKKAGEEKKLGAKNKVLIAFQTRINAKYGFGASHAYEFFELWLEHLPMSSYNSSTEHSVNKILKAGKQLGSGVYDGLCLNLPADHILDMVSTGDRAKFLEHWLFDKGGWWALRTRSIADTKRLQNLLQKWLIETKWKRSKNATEFKTGLGKITHLIEKFLDTVPPEIFWGYILKTKKEPTWESLLFEWIIQFLKQPWVFSRVTDRFSAKYGCTNSFQVIGRFTKAFYDMSVRCIKAITSTVKTKVDSSDIMDEDDGVDENAISIVQDWAKNRKNGEHDVRMAFVQFLDLAFEYVLPDALDEMNKRLTNRDDSKSIDVVLGFAGTCLKQYANSLIWDDLLTRPLVLPEQGEKKDLDQDRKDSHAKLTLGNLFLGSTWRKMGESFKNLFSSLANPINSEVSSTYALRVRSLFRDCPQQRIIDTILPATKSLLRFEMGPAHGSYLPDDRNSMQQVINTITSLVSDVVTSFGGTSGEALAQIGLLYSFKPPTSLSNFLQDGAYQQVDARTLEVDRSIFFQVTELISRVIKGLDTVAMKEKDPSGDVDRVSSAGLRYFASYQLSSWLGLKSSIETVLARLFVITMANAPLLEGDMIAAVWKLYVDELRGQKQLDSTADVHRLNATEETMLSREWTLLNLQHFFPSLDTAYQYFGVEVFCLLKAATSSHQVEVVLRKFLQFVGAALRCWDSGSGINDTIHYDASSPCIYYEQFWLYLSLIDYQGWRPGTQKLKLINNSSVAEGIYWLLPAIGQPSVIYKSTDKVQNDGDGEASDPISYFSHRSKETLTNPEKKKMMIREASMPQQDQRMGGHIQLLEASLNQWESAVELTASLAFTCNRIKNESGLIRPKFYASLDQNINDIVEKTIWFSPNERQHRWDAYQQTLGTTPDQSIDTEEPWQLKNTKLLMSLLIKFLKDDLKKRDTVAADYFHDIAKKILVYSLTRNTPTNTKYALEGTLFPVFVPDESASRLVQQLREIWIEGALQIQLMLLENRDGNFSLTKYSFNNGYNITDTVFSNKEDPEMNLDGTDTEILEIIKAREEGMTIKTGMTPAESVDTFLKLFEQAQIAAGVDPAFVSITLDSELESLKEMKSALGLDVLYKRLEWLFKFVSDRWLEVPLLRSFVETLGITMKKCVEELRVKEGGLAGRHTIQRQTEDGGEMSLSYEYFSLKEFFTWVNKFLKNVLIKWDSCWFAVPQIESLFCTCMEFSLLADKLIIGDSAMGSKRNANNIQEEMSNVKDDANYYLELAEEKIWSASPRVQKLVQFCRELESKQAYAVLCRISCGLSYSWLVGGKHKKTRNAGERKMIEAFLLELDSTLIFSDYRHVQKLIAYRDDLLKDKVIDPTEMYQEDNIDGSVREVKSQQQKRAGLFQQEMKDFCFSDFRQQQLKQLNARDAKAFGNRSLAQALSRKQNVASKAQKVTEYVCCPATSYQDVISLLEDLVFSDVHDESDAQALTESLILSIFKTDSAWQILAYLLTPRVIAKNDQRTTATLLQSLYSEQGGVRTGKVVQLLHVLLTDKRRWAVKIFLHKMILRFLMTVHTDDSAAIVEMEWNRLRRRIAGNNDNVSTKKKRSREEEQVDNLKVNNEILVEIVQMAMERLDMKIANSEEPEKGKDEIAGRPGTTLALVNVCWQIIEDIASHVEEFDYSNTIVAMLLGPVYRPGKSKTDDELSYEKFQNTYYNQNSIEELFHRSVSGEHEWQGFESRDSKQSFDRHLLQTTGIERTTFRSKEEKLEAEAKVKGNWKLERAFSSQRFVEITSEIQKSKATVTFRSKENRDRYVDRVLNKMQQKVHSDGDVLLKSQVLVFKLNLDPGQKRDDMYSDELKLLNVLRAEITKHFDRTKFESVGASEECNAFHLSLLANLYANLSLWLMTYEIFVQRKAEFTPQYVTGYTLKNKTLLRNLVNQVESSIHFQREMVAGMIAECFNAPLVEEINDTKIEYRDAAKGCWVEKSPTTIESSPAVSGAASGGDKTTTIPVYGASDNNEEGYDLVQSILYDTTTIGEKKLAEKSSKCNLYVPGRRRMVANYVLRVMKNVADLWSGHKQLEECGTSWKQVLISQPFKGSVSLLQETIRNSTDFLEDDYGYGGGYGGGYGRLKPLFSI